MNVPSNTKQVNNAPAAAPSRPASKPAPADKNEARSSTAAKGAEGTDRAVRAAEIGISPVRAATASTDALEETVDVAAKKVRSARGRSLRKELSDFVMPKIGDPSILQANSAIRVMEDFVVNVLPKLEGTKELRSLAQAVIKDEITRHRALLDRRHHGIAA